MHASRVVWIGRAHLWKLLFRPLEVLQQTGLTTPKANAARDIFCADIAEHADIVIEIAAAVEQAFHANGAR